MAKGKGAKSTSSAKVKGNKSSEKGKGKKDKAKKDKGGSKKSITNKQESEIDPGVALLWEENLKAAVINDGRWKCNVTILLESKSEYTKFLEWFEDGAKAGSRRVIKNIANTDLILELKLSHGKKGMTKFHPLQGVCTAAAKQLSGGKVPTDILAKLLKYKIIRFKEADLSSRRAQILEERELQRTVQRMMENDKVKSVPSEASTGKKKKDGKGSGKSGKKSAADKESKGKGKGKGKEESKGGKEKKGGKDKSKGGKDSKKGKGKVKKKVGDDETNECWDGSNLVPIETPEKWNTKLRKRGEDWKDVHLIDDAPKDGADLYVVLTGFHDPQLIVELIKLGVPVNAVVKLNLELEEEVRRLDSILTLEENRAMSNIFVMPEHPKRNASMLESPCGNDKKQPPGQSRKFPTTLNEVEMKAAEIMSFWTELKDFNKDRDKLTLLKDVAFVTFPAPTQLSKIPTNSEEIVEYQKTMYDVITNMLYDMERLTRQHTNYVRHIKLLNLEPAIVINNLERMDIYNTMVQLMPSECQTLSFIMHCMIEQVDALCHETEVLDILAPQQDLYVQKSTEVGVMLQKGTSKEETTIMAKNKLKGDISANKTGSPKEGTHKGGSKEMAAAKKGSSREASSSKGDSMSPRAKKSKEGSKERVDGSGNKSVPELELPILDTSKIDMVQASLDTRVKELNKEYDLFQVPSPRAVKRDPLVILYRDAKTQKSFHVALAEVDLAAIFENKVKHGRISVIWNKYKEQTIEEKLKHDFHIHQLWKCMEERNLTLRMLKNQLHLLIFEKMAGNAETIDITCNKMLQPRRQSVNTVCTAGFMGFTDKLFKSKHNKLPAALQHPIQTPLSDPSIDKPVLQDPRADSRSSHMESIGEMFESPDIICLTDPLKYVLTGVRTVNQRAAVLDLHKYTVVEEYNTNTMLQHVVIAHERFNGCTVQYYAPTDVVLLNFHNCNERTELRQGTWMAKITTPVGFRDFCEFVYDEETQWLDEQEVEYERGQREVKEKGIVTLPGGEVIEGKEESMKTGACADEEFIKVGSIKHNEMLKKQLGNQAEDVEVEGKGGKKRKGKEKSKKGKEKKEKKPKEKKAGKEKKNKSLKGSKGKKDKTGTAKSEKKKKEKKEKKEEEIDLETEVEIPFVSRPSFHCAKEGEPHSYEGYDLCPFRLQIDGKSSYFFAPDGTEVQSEITSWLFSNIKELKTCVQKRDHCLFVYSMVEYDQPRVEKPFNFHVVSAFKCILAFGERQNPQVPPRKPTIVTEPPGEVNGEALPQKRTSLINKPTKDKGSVSKRSDSIGTTKIDKVESNKSKSKMKQSDQDNHRSSASEPEPNRPSLVQPPEDVGMKQEPKWKYDLKASWPSGLVLETVMGSSPLDPFHFKQRYLQKGPECEKIRDEDHRIFLRNGTVLKFMSNGFVEVLCPDSTITVCQSFKKPESYSRQNSITSPRKIKPPDCPEDVRMDGKEGLAGTREDDRTKTARAKRDSVSSTRSLGVIKPLPPEMEVVQYHVITPNGRQFSVQENIDQFPNLTEATRDISHKPIDLVVVDDYEKFLLRVATDYELGEVFTRRGDGTNTLLMPNGSLIVVFPDGTRITSSYTIDNEPVTLEWTEDEKMAVMTQIAIRQDKERRLEEEALATECRHSTTASIDGDARKESLGNVGFRRGSLQKDGKVQEGSQAHVDKKEKKIKNKATGSRKSSITKHGRSSSKDMVVESNVNRASTGSNTGAENNPPEITIDPEIFSDEGFVSIHMNCCLEHPNYATVSFMGGDKSAEIDMPYDMTINVSPEGLYSANIDDRSKLEVKDDSIIFQCFSCPNCNTLNTTTINLNGFQPTKTDQADSETCQPPDVFCTTLDGWGHSHTISYNGVSTLHLLNKEFDENVENSEDQDVDNIYSTRRETSQCLPPSSKWIHRRCFVLHRDLSGEEMLHAEDAISYIRMVKDMAGTAVVTDKVPNKSGMRYHTILCPILKTESQKWLMEYKSKYILPHNMRKKHLRSTYGDPPCWYHPFPKKQIFALSNASSNMSAWGERGGDGDGGNNQDNLTLRILQEMEPRDQGDNNVIANIQEGLIKYWNAAAEKFKEYADHPTQDPRTEEEVEIEEELLRAALGQATVSVPEMFRRSHRTLGPKFGAIEKLQSRVSAHAAYLENVYRKRAEAEADKEAYRAILRNRTIPPYFQSVAGESFLGVMSIMNNAISESEERDFENKRNVLALAKDLVESIVENNIVETAEDVVQGVVESLETQTMEQIGNFEHRESKKTQTR